MSTPRVTSGTSGTHPARLNVPSMLPVRGGLPPRLRVRLVVLLFIVAGVWRAVIATSMPCIARDSVTFCEYARDLGQRGTAYLREPTTRQHPLYPALVLGAQRVARLTGMPENPRTWIRAGQVVSWLAGMCVVALAGVVTRRLVRELELPVDAQVAGTIAVALAAILPLGVELSAEVMSDGLHAALYLLGAWCMLRMTRLREAAGSGLAAGLAFLTRPEGAVLVIGGTVAALAARGSAWRARIGRAAIVAGVFLACAAPYWMLTGSLSTKKNPLDWLREAGAAATFEAPQAAILAKLDLLNLPWWALLPWALYTLLRAGRVIVPLAAIPALIHVRRRLFGRVLAGWTTCLILHLALTLALLDREGYLAPRHLLVVVLLLLAFSATFFAWSIAQWAQRGWPRSAGFALLIALAVPLAGYALRLPNANDRYLVEAADALAEQDPLIRGGRILCASSPRRTVFYAGAAWIPWYETPGRPERLVRRIQQERPDYFIIETGTGFEREGHDEVVQALLSAEPLGPHFGRIYRRTIPGGVLHAFQFRW